MPKGQIPAVMSEQAQFPDNSSQVHPLKKKKKKKAPSNINPTSTTEPFIGFVPLPFSIYALIKLTYSLDHIRDGPPVDFEHAILPSHRDMSTIAYHSYPTNPPIGPAMEFVVTPFNHEQPLLTQQEYPQYGLSSYPPSLPFPNLRYYYAHAASAPDIDLSQQNHVRPGPPFRYPSPRIPTLEVPYGGQNVSTPATDASSWYLAPKHNLRYILSLMSNQSIRQPLESYTVGLVGEVSSVTVP